MLLKRFNLALQVTVDETLQDDIERSLEAFEELPRNPAS